MSKGPRYEALVERDFKYRHLYRITIIDTLTGSFRAEYAATTERQAQSTAEHELRWLNRE